MDFKEMNDALESKMTALNSTIESMKEEGATKVEIQKVTDEIVKHGELLAEITEGANDASGKSFHQQASTFFKENKDKLKDIHQKGTGVLTFTPNEKEMENHANKAVGDIFRANGTLATAVPPYNDVSMSNVNFRRDDWIVGLCNTANTNSASYPYTEVVDGEGAIAYTAEGGTKPQLDLDWSVSYATPYKPAGYEVLTEEVVDDVPRILSVAQDHLRQKHNLAKVNGIMFGDGVGENPKGATVVAGTFTGTGMTGAFPAGTATIMDIINAMVTEIYTTHNFVDEAPNMVNLVLMNPIDFFLNFQAAKDANKWPLYGGVQLFNSYQIGGMTIMPWEKIPGGKIFVGDMKKYNLTNYKPYSLRVGWINDQMITNKFTIVGESRHHAFVKSLDELAFQYDDIATVQGIIESA